MREQPTGAVAPTKSMTKLVPRRVRRRIAFVDDPDAMKIEVVEYLRGSAGALRGPQLTANDSDKKGTLWRS